MNQSKTQSLEARIAKLEEMVGKLSVCVCALHANAKALAALAEIQAKELREAEGNSLKERVGYVG